MKRVRRRDTWKEREREGEGVRERNGQLQEVRLCFDASDDISGPLPNFL